MALEAKNIYFRYNAKKPWILEDQSLKVEKGERLALSAPSGCGKSTLAMILAGYLKPSAGQVLADGKPLPAKGLCPVQLIFQHPEKAVNPRWRLRRVLEESGGLNEDMLNAFGIEPAWLDRFSPGSSPAANCSVSAWPGRDEQSDYLICDEISTMLDVITQAQIWNLMLHEVEKRKIGLLAVTHNMALAEQVCTRNMKSGGGESYKIYRGKQV